LPDFFLPSSEKQKAAATGTDDKPVEMDSSAYKKLTKNSYFDGLSPIGTAAQLKDQEGSDMGALDKSLQKATLDTG